ncbi:MAG TPA: hypothetical protein VIK65_12270 [Candidatus Limnocylindrales bacterium]|jgi:nitrogen fixation-related uncharacterized protein
MEALATVAAILIGLVGLGVASVRWGADSRQLGDCEPRWSIR